MRNNLDDEWFRNHKAEQRALEKKQGINPKKYFLLKYDSFGRLSQYQETEDSPLMERGEDGVTFKLFQEKPAKKTRKRKRKE